MSISFEAGTLQVGAVALPDVAAAVGTPVYVYDAAGIGERYRRLEAAFAALPLGIRYAVKANSNEAILRLLRELGAGFDLVSGGELARALRARCDPNDCVFAGVGKQDEEIREALRQGVGLLNVESPSELERIQVIAQELDVEASVAIRLNPDVAVRTHAYISTGKKENKFGVGFAVADAMLRSLRADPRVQLRAYHVHLGSLLLEPGPYLEALALVLDWMDADPLRSEGICAYDMGGGLGIRGAFDEPLALEELAAGMREMLTPRGLRLLMEPGRYLVGNAGLVLTRVLHVKHGSEKDFAVVDAAMTELIRPALYAAEHEIVTVKERAGLGPRPVDVVGPVCESADFLGQGLRLPALERGDLLAVLTAGAYGASMGSRYNSRPLAAEVLIDGGEARLVRRKETIEELWRHECEQVLDLGEAGTDEH
ncbi:MAG: diaminopimelate decarboxylase [Planctomycetota bacterium]|nr:MAG: diaminopimelate decarboxylase [Planctomycetota bacterium]